MLRQYRIRQHRGIDPETGLPQVSLHEFDVVDAGGNAVNDGPLHPRAAARLLARKNSERAEVDMANQDSDTPVQNTQEEKPIQWVKTGGGALRITLGGQRRIIKENQRFMARPGEIPVVFRDVIKPVDPKLLTEEQPLGVVTGGYHIKSTGPGWYAVFDINGKRVNEKALRVEQARAMLEDLQG